VQLKWGSYTFDAFSAEVATDTEAVLNQYGMPYEYRQIYHVKGYLKTTSQSDCTQKSNALINALATPFQKLVLLQENGQESAIILPVAGAIKPPVVTHGPIFNHNQGAEYNTQRYYEFTVEATYPAPKSSNLILNWSERLTIAGGGRLRNVRPCLNGPPVSQIIFNIMPTTAVQQGKAEGFRSYPTPAAAIWPQALKESPTITRIAPIRVGPSTYTNYVVEWSYTYISAGPLVGFPTIWKG
jgi:hypothetical protein